MSKAFVESGMLLINKYPSSPSLLTPLFPLMNTMRNVWEAEFRDMAVSALLIANPWRTTALNGAMAGFQTTDRSQRSDFLSDVSSVISISLTPSSNPPLIDPRAASSQPVGGKRMSCAAMSAMGRLLNHISEYQFLTNMYPKFPLIRFQGTIP